MIIHQSALNEIMKHMTRLETLWKKKLLRPFSRMSKTENVNDNATVLANMGFYNSNEVSAWKKNK